MAPSSGTDLSIKIGADSKEAENNVSRFQKEFNELTDALKKPLGEIDAFVRMKKNLIETEGEFQKAQAECNRLAAEIRNSENPTKQMSKEFDRAKASAGALKDSIATQRATLQELRSSLNAAGVNTAALGTEQARLRKSLQDTERAALAEAEAQKKAAHDVSEAAIKEAEAKKKAADEAERAALAELEAEKKAAASRQVLVDAHKTVGVRPWQEIHAEVGKLEEAYKTLKASGTASMAELAQAKLKVAEKTRELNEQTSGWLTSLEKAKGSVAALAGAGAGWALSINAAKEFEAAMSDVAKVVEAPQEKLKSLEDRILSLTRTIPLSAVEIAKIAEAGGQMGIAANQIEEFVVATAKISTAFKMSAEQAGETIGKLMNIWHTDVAGVSSLADSINVLGNEFNTTEAKVSEVLVRIGAMPKLFGLSAQEAAALAASILSLGKTPEVAATGINALLSKLQTANIQAPEFKAALAGIGVSARQLATDINEHPQQALLSFLQTLGKLDKQTKTETLTKLFGQEYQDDIAAVVDSVGLYERALSMATDTTKAAGSVNKEFERGMETLKNQLALARNAVAELGIVIGATALPAMKSMASTGAGAAHAAADFAKAFPGLTDLILLLGTGAAAFGTLAIAGKASAAVLAKIFEPVVATAAITRASLVAMNAAAAETIGTLGLMKAASPGVVTALGGIATAAGVATVALSAVQVGRLFEAIGEARQATRDLESMAAAQVKAADEFKAYKDARIRGAEELRSMNQEAMLAESDTLQKALHYWVRYREALTMRSEERNSIGMMTDEAKRAQAELPIAKMRVDQYSDGLMALGSTAREVGVRVDLFSGKITDAAAKPKLLSDSTDKAVDSMRARMADLGGALSEYGRRLSEGKITLTEYNALAKKAWEEHAAAAKSSFEQSAAGLARWRDDTKSAFEAQVDEAAAAHKKLTDQIAAIEWNPREEGWGLQGLREKAEAAKKHLEDLRNTAGIFAAEVDAKAREMAEANLAHLSSLMEGLPGGGSVGAIVQQLQVLRSQGVLTGEVIDKQLVGSFSKLSYVDLQGIQSQLEGLKKGGRGRRLAPSRHPERSAWAGRSRRRKVQVRHDNGRERCSRGLRACGNQLGSFCGCCDGSVQCGDCESDRAEGNRIPQAIPYPGGKGWAAFDRPGDGRLEAPRRKDGRSKKPTRRA